MSTSITYEIEAKDARKSMWLGGERVSKGGGYIYGPLDLLSHAEIVATELQQLGFKTVHIWKTTTTRVREEVTHGDG